jgi:hypothetical protein
MSKQRNVLIVSSCRFDTAQAEAYGKVVFVYDETTKLPTGIFNTRACMADMSKRLREIQFDADLDCIAVTGNMALNVMLFMVASEHHPEGRVNALIWDARDKEYKMRELDPSSCRVGEDA